MSQRDIGSNRKLLNRYLETFTKTWPETGVEHRLIEVNLDCYMTPVMLIGEVFALAGRV